MSWEPQVGQVSSTFMNTLLIADGQIDASYNFLQPLQKMTTKKLLYSGKFHVAVAHGDDDSG
nr:hypothetical protein [Leptolyngbyaceae cyanobacterium MO_188.B28]